MKWSVVGVVLLLALICVSCGDTRKDVTVKAGLSVVCAPANLPQGQWATLTILQLYEPGQTVVELRTEKLAEVALVGKRFEVFDHGRGGGYRLQTYTIKPNGKTLTLDESFFKGIPKGEVIPPMTISVVD